MIKSKVYLGQVSGFETPDFRKKFEGKYYLSDSKGNNASYLHPDGYWRRSMSAPLPLCGYFYTDVEAINFAHCKGYEVVVEDKDDKCVSKIVIVEKTSGQRWCIRDTNLNFYLYPDGLWYDVLGLYKTPLYGCFFTEEEAVALAKFMGYIIQPKEEENTNTVYVKQFHYQTSNLDGMFFGYLEFNGIVKYLCSDGQLHRNMNKSINKYNGYFHTKEEFVALATKLGYQVIDKT